MTQAFSVVIPARFASTRFPGKPLQDIAGMSMIQRVWLQAQKSAAQQVVIATDDQRIFAECQSFGAQVLMTRDDHESGTDRLAEVVAQLALPSDAIVVNVQGDEPLIPPAVINQVAENLAQYQQAAMATLAPPKIATNGLSGASSALAITLSSFSMRKPQTAVLTKPYSTIPAVEA